MKPWAPTRRTILKGSVALAAGTVAGTSSVLGQDFPSRNMKVVVPTREGGGADRNLRAVTGVWKKYLGATFEAGFFPGASGRVGYEVYMNKRDPDCYNLLFGNMGPEVLNWVVRPPTSFKFPGDYVYFARVDVDPSVVFARAESPFKTIDDVVAEGKKRTLSVATSRLAHPASVGILALGEATGAKFNLIPLSGGKNTTAGVVTGETDLGVLPSGSVAARGEVVRTLLVFNDVNPLPEQLNNAPTVNDHFGTELPPLVSSRAFAVHTAAMEKHPERFQKLIETLQPVFADPDYKTAAQQARQPWPLINPGSAEVCQAYVENIIAIGNRFKPLLTGKG